MSEARVICSTNDLVGYDEVVITGGEPLLYPDALIDFIKNVRSANPKAKIYLYTATMPPHKPFFVPLLMSLLNGIHYTIHAEATQTDIDDFHHFQAYAKLYSSALSFRLYIDNRCTIPAFIQPNVWVRAEIKGWIDNGNCPLPMHEHLLIWGPKVEKKLDIVYR
jgi:organic radical activating enzyme